MPPLLQEPYMEVLSPRSANLPVHPRTNTMKKSESRPKPKPEEKPANPDRIDDKWRPPVAITEPGVSPHTYVVGKKLGKGGFAVCFEGTTQSNSELFALKVVKAKVEQKKMLEKFRTEMQIHAKMRHPNIVEFYRAFSLDGHTYVVLEMCGNGSLTDMVKARSCLSLPEVRRFMIQICGGVKYMHRRNVIHRDLKMGNIFIDSQMNLKIGDFGLAAVMADEQDRRTTLCGTPNYIAPEILSKSGTRGHDSKVDTWAIGIICYAMLIGIPPFQSKTQQEIYSKLRTLDYEWKVDSKNYIPQEAKDCVTSCLNLTSADRPEMDDLVEHPFFKIGAVADVLDVACAKSTPTWLENADPRGDRVRRGYGVEHARICSECGVGRTSSGQPRPAVGLKAKISTLVEIEAENRQGCAPVTPLPEGILYRQFTDPEPERLVSQKASRLPAQPRSRKPIDDAREILSGISTDMMLGATSSRVPSSTRPAQSFAAQQRQQALPTRNTVRMTRAEIPEQAVVSEVIPEAIPEKKVIEQTGLLRAKPIRAASARATRSTQVQQNTLTKSKTIPGNLDEMDVRQKDEAVEPSQPSQPRRHVRPRSAQIPAEVVEKIPSAASTSSSETERPSSRAEPAKATLSLRPKSQTATGTSEATRKNMHTKVIERQAPSRNVMKSRMIEENEAYTSALSTSHTHLMRSLRNLHASLGATSTSIPSSTSASYSNTRSGTRGAKLNTTAPYPRVEKWVDYATKHGIAYMLTDGTLGMILKSRDEDNIPSCCTVVRNAKRHTELRAKGREYQFVPQGRGVSDIEFYEQPDPAEPMRRLDVPSEVFYLDLEGHNGSQSAAANATLSGLRGPAAQRLKEIGLLDKFGKYMHKQMGSGSGSSDSSSNPHLEGQDDEGVGHFVHFYQRLGNVGAWRFADGGLQFNFPDHTKLVIYESPTTLSSSSTTTTTNSNDVGVGSGSRSGSDVLVDAIYLEPRDARDMADLGAVTHEALERRDLKTFRLEDIRNTAGGSVSAGIGSGLRRTELEIIRTNEIREKLDWIRAVIGCWIKEGGLGCMGDDQRLGWSGLQERRDDKKIKLQWVTVGRPGGDGSASGAAAAGTAPADS